MSSGERGIMDVPASVVNSRSSFVVKAAWSRPRRPMMDTWRTAERRRTSRTGAGTSYFSRSRGGVSNIRATSSATLPWQMRSPTRAPSCVGVAASGGMGVGYTNGRGTTRERPGQTAAGHDVRWGWRNRWKTRKRGGERDIGKACETGGGVWGPTWTLPKKRRRESAAAWSNLCVQF